MSVCWASHKVNDETACVIHIEKVLPKQQATNDWATGAQASR